MSVPTSLEKFRSELQETFGAEARIDRMSRGLYSTDASIYQQTPLAAVTPRDALEVRSLLRLAAYHEVPVLARGGGTSLAGQTTAQGAVVCDVSKHLIRLVELEPRARIALVEPGLVRDRLNAMIAPHGLMFAPETSTSNRANIGGMIANNSSGMMSIRYGKTIDHTLGVRGFLADGAELWFGPRAEMNARGNALLDRLLALIEKNRKLIETKFPRVMRRVGGYSLDEFLHDEDNLAKIIAGSEGTLAVMTSARVKLVPVPKHVVSVAVHFTTLDASLRASVEMVKHRPLSAELMDGVLIRMSRGNPNTADKCKWVVGEPGAVIAVEMDADTCDEAVARLDALIADLQSKNYGYAWVRMTDPAECKALAEVRKAGLGVMTKMVGDAKPLSFVEDACVPVERLADYAQRVVDICQNEGVQMLSYGHASVGVLHLKPVLNLKSEAGRKQLARISNAVVEVVKEFGGSWSGEHGDGIARGANNEQFWGPEMMDVFRDVKRIFDPRGLLNPGKIFDTPPVDGPLRYTSGYGQYPKASMFHFREEGGHQGAVEMCNGVGACRKTGSGTMCPSYMATREEKDSTRGRANALRLAMSGQLGTQAMTSKALHDVMDLCLSCKACKTECPSNVDLSKLKAEFLDQYHAQHGASRRDRLFANSAHLAKLNSGWLAPFANAMLGIAPLRRVINRALGVAPVRPLPRYARTTLPDWFARHRPRTDGNAGTVVLFDDTYARYHEPGIGRWSVRVLEALGYRVKLANAGCCGRPLISKGFLTEAKAQGTRTMQRLDKFARAGIPILTMEPSCASALRDDLPDLIDDGEAGARVRSMVRPVEAFVAEAIKSQKVDATGWKRARRYLVHGHCHQKALESTSPTKALLGSGAAEVDSGCCGMAGSFGYEEEHYDLSQQIGEQRLFPAVRKEPGSTVLVANGFSCRHQIHDGTGRRAMHAIEAIGRAMNLR